MKAKLVLLLNLLIIFSCSKDVNQSQITDTELVLVDLFSNLSFTQPVDFQQANDATTNLYVVEKGGVIIMFENYEFLHSSIFLDIESKVNTTGEQGLLGLAFHPNFVENGYFYVNYNPDIHTTNISRFKISDSGDGTADPNSELVLLSFPQHDWPHNGGQLAFGPDGYLYISSGDGGDSSNGQDLSTLTGTILRIDVDNPSDGLNYGIPPDNPFISDTEARNEIYAYGLRNPWRMSFDSATGKLWAGDVGSGYFEEINIIEKGENYGWQIIEGNRCFVAPCDTDGLVQPFYEYGHDPNGSAITGGYVYRGSLNTELIGKYIYADYISGKIWSLDIDTKENTLLFDTEMLISSFGIDKNNELYVLDIGGEVYKFVQEQSD
jgi:glucose/arabinose dehydrogenase